MAERINFFDVLRGLAIVGVVSIHASGSITQINQDTIGFYCLIVWRNFWNFSVPLFLSISGYFLAKKSFVETRDYHNFISKQIPRVYWPLLFWSIIWFLLAIVNKSSISSELVKLVTFQSSGPYYFIALIVQYYLLLPILKYLANFKGLVASVIVSCIAIFLIFYIRYFSASDLPLIMYAGNFLTWLVFFVFGLYLGSGNKIIISNKNLFIGVVCFYFFSILESYFLTEWFNQPKDAVTAIKFSSFSYSLALIAYLFKNQGIIHSNLLQKVGSYSFGIYLTHMFTLNLEQRALHKFLPNLDQVLLLHQVALTAVVVLTCMIFIYLVNRLVTNKISMLIGFH